jgi:hypothetical protein
MLSLDTNAAKAADNKSAFIDEAGKYTGTFTRAEYMENGSTGSTGLGLTFKSNSGAEAQFYVNLSYQHGTKNDGGHAILNAVMACLQLRKVDAPRTITVEKWNKDAKQREKVDVYGFPELMGKPIGLLIQMEIEKSSENGAPRPTIYAPFSAESEKTASEVLDPKCTHPAKLEKMVQQIMARPIIDRRPKGYQQAPSTNSAPPTDWDDIPFD